MVRVVYNDGWVVDQVTRCDQLDRKSLSLSLAQGPPTLCMQFGNCAKNSLVVSNTEEHQLKLRLLFCLLYDNVSLSPSCDLSLPKSFLFQEAACDIQ